MGASTSHQWLLIVPFRFAKYLHKIAISGSFLQNETRKPLYYRDVNFTFFIMLKLTDVICNVTSFRETTTWLIRARNENGNFCKGCQEKSHSFGAISFPIRKCSSSHRTKTDMVDLLHPRNRAAFGEVLRIAEESTLL